MRPPVVAVMGHVDHGKSALLDYIRKTNVVDDEVGGITQRVSAYEVEHEHEGATKHITFLDTPGHEAFAKIRARGATVADVAILVVSAEEGVKPQTLDALAAIKRAGIPYVVAINKIDKPNADVQRVKSSLVENEIYIEGMGGDIPFAEVSAKTGAGIDELLDTVLLVAEFEELTGDPDKAAEGVVIETNRDAKKGIAATLVIKDGTLNSGEFVVAESAIAPVRIFENFAGTPIKHATFSSPVRIIGFDALPSVGASFRAYGRKKDAELARSIEKKRPATPVRAEDDPRHLIPLIVKADSFGTIEAIHHELDKLKNDRVVLHVIQEGVGPVSESDVQAAVASSYDPLIIAFNVSIDPTARDVAMQHEKRVNTFEIIYKLSEWLATEIAARTPKVAVDEELGIAKIVMHFSSMKDKHVVGGKVKRGEVRKDARVRLHRSGEIVSEGRVLNLQVGKQDASHADEGSEFGAQVQCDVTPAAGDTLECYEVVEK